MIGREAGSNASNGSDPKRLKDASTHLPEGWEERSDPVSGKPFYVNLATGTAYSQHPGLRKKSSVDRDSTDQDVSTCFGGYEKEIANVFCKAFFFFFFFFFF
jgi:hypothetical protein